jgi:lysyl-tRNA synthetase class 2
VHEIRQFFHSRGYVEVETPAMQAIPGGAAAQPFKTFHNALGCEFYLRIALELYHKRLLVGGIDKLFEIGKNFRNEGLSRRHNPEFTMLEAYDAFGDYETMMETVESLIKHVAQKVLGTLKIPLNQNHTLAFLIGGLASRSLTDAKNHILEVEDSEGNRNLFVSTLKKLAELHEQIGSKPYWEIASEARSIVEEVVATLKQVYERPEISSKLSKEVIEEDYGWVEGLPKCFLELSTEAFIDLSSWRRAKYKDLIREKAGADWFDIPPAKRRQRAHEMGAEIGKEYEDFEVTGAVFEKLIEPTLIQPTFVTHLPKELVPLAKLSPDDPTTVEVFECCINGQEISPGYTEQNDPIAQRNTLEHQAGGEQQKLDEDFLVALEHGMPPAGGIGIGIDRLCMMLLGQESIRDVILFPQLKPK